MATKQIRLVVLAATVVVMAFVFGITSWLNIASFKKNYTESLMAGYTVVGSEPVRNVEYALKYGKPLANFFGIEKILGEAKAGSPEIENIMVALADGTVVYDLKGKVDNRKIPEKMLAEINFGPDNLGVSNTSLLYEGKYHNFLPIRDRHNQWIGELDLQFDQSVVEAEVSRYTAQTLRYCAVLALIAFILLSVFLFKINILDEAGQISKNRFLAIVLVILGLVQVVFGYLNFNMFKNSYTDVAKQTISKMAIIVQKDINQVVDKGLAYSELFGVEGWFKKIIRSTPEIEKIYLYDNQNQVLYSTDTGQQTKNNDNGYVYKQALKKDTVGNGAGVSIVLAKKYIDSKVFNIALDMLTVLVTSFFFMVEVTILMVVFIGRKINKEKQAGKVEHNDDVRIIRPLAFVFYYSAFMSISFIPTLMKSFYEPILGLPENVVLGLPISVELLCGGLAIVFAGYIIGTRGWKPVFFAGLALFEIGALLSGIATGPIAFIGARGVFGLGYGFALIAMQGFVNSAKTEGAKSEGMASLGSGTYAGINCACVIGAMLAERIGYSQVFFVTLAIALIAGAFALIFMPNAKIAAIGSQPETAKAPSIGAASFFGNRNIFSFFLFIVIPVAIGSMFLEYFVPVYAKGAGISSANVGRAFLINGLAVVYLGPLLNKYLGKSLGAKKSAVLAGLTVSTAFLIFAFQGGFLAILLTAFLLGLADGLGGPAQNGYLLGLNATNAMGEGKALGFYSVAIKAGQVLGPVCFALAMSLGPDNGVGVIGISIIAALMLFLLINVRKQDKEKSISI